MVKHNPTTEHDTRVFNPRVRSDIIRRIIISLSWVLNFPHGTEGKNKK